MKSLTSKEQEILNFIKSYTSKHDFPPSYEEIQKKFNYKSVNSVQQFILQLTTKGYLKSSIGENQKRAIEAIDEERSDVRLIPLEGTVAAGRLTEAVQNREFVEIPKSVLRNGPDYFALKVKGDSMIEDAIINGDMVVVKRQSEANNGQIVVAMVSNEATIKRYYKKKNKIELHPANPAFDIIIVEPNEEFRVLGVLASVIRRCD